MQKLYVEKIVANCDQAPTRELKPCSHCGSLECEIHGEMYSYRGWCRNCGAEGPPAITRSDANVAWNERVWHDI